MIPEETTSILTWWLAGGFFIVGLILGGVIYSLIHRCIHRPVDSQAAASEQQLIQYRAAVLHSFNETSMHLQHLGADYQRLVEHISKNMHELCTSADGKPLIPPPFPSVTKHSTNGFSKSDVMPKTYVDPKKPHRDL